MDAGPIGVAPPTMVRIIKRVRRLYEHGASGITYDVGWYGGLAVADGGNNY